MPPIEEIYQSYAKTVYKYLMSLTQDADLAEELTQETFYQAIRSVERFDGSCKMSTWLCAIAKRVLSTWRRKHPATADLESAAREGDLAKSVQSTSGESQVMESAEAQVLAQEERVGLFRMIHALEEPYREIVYLRIFGELSFREIGDIYGRTENWARVTFYRGKGKLQKEAKEHE